LAAALTRAFEMIIAAAAFFLVVFRAAFFTAFRFAIGILLCVLRAGS
jgi:hypothetical protein